MVAKQQKQVRQQWSDEAILAAFQRGGSSGAPKVLGKYRASSTIGRIAGEVSKAPGKWVTYIHLVRALKDDPAKVARRLRTFQRHGRVNKTWRVELSSSGVKFTPAAAK